MGTTMERAIGAATTTGMNEGDSAAGERVRDQRSLVHGDDELVARVLGGDLAAYDALMRRYEQLVSRVAFGFGGSREDALDITQEVFLKVYDNLGSYRQGSNFRAWLLRITSNQGVSFLRKHRRHVQGRDPLEADDARPIFVDHSQSAEKDVLRGERMEQLVVSLQHLTPRYRAALLMRYFQELSIREISAELVCTEAVTKSLLFRGVRRLRELMPSETEDDRPTGEGTYEPA